MIYNIGTRTTIYEDPITKQKPEGQATLRELYKENGCESYWRVEFDDESGAFYERTIYIEEGDEIQAEANDEI